MLNLSSIKNSTIFCEDSLVPSCLKRLYWVCSLVLCILCVSHVSHAQNMNSVLPCNEPNILLIVDHSGSMDDDRKWEQAIDALELLTFGFADNLRFGLMFFPSRGQCGIDLATGLLNPILPNNGDAIRGSLRGLRRPEGRTPLESSLLTGIQYLNQLNDRDRKNIIVLITDGLDTCARNEFQDPINAAANANNQGYPVFVIGFATSAQDERSLQGIAQAGGTDNYRLAQNSDELFTALENIAISLQGEECDGQDNDCDGIVDEDIEPKRCDTQCGIGEILCLNGQESECAGGMIPPEICDGVDNDCDGHTDEVESSPCLTEMNEPGTQECLGNGEVGDCLPDDPTMDEICDGQDNDRDGATDEGTNRPCNNLCNQGEEVCVNGNLLACNAAPVEEVESCNGIDEDCDMIIDEDAICPMDQICGSQGECLLPCQNSECPLGFVCEPDNYCHPLPCDPACTDGRRCIAQQCVMICGVDADCTIAGEICDQMRRMCVPTMSMDTGTDIFSEDNQSNTGGVEVPVTPMPMIVGENEEEVEEKDAGSSCQATTSLPLLSSLWMMLYLGLGLYMRKRLKSQHHPHA